MRRKKEKHVWSVQIMNELLKRASMYEYDDDGSRPQSDSRDKPQDQDKETDPYSAYNQGSDCISEEQQPSTTNGEVHPQNKGTIRTYLVAELKI